MPKQFRDENSNESGPSDGEKPLKKARFVWQLKGKHHLKESVETNTVDNEEKNQDEQLSETDEQNIDLVGNEATSSNSHKSGCNCCCLQSLLEKTSDDINNELDKISNDINFTMGCPDSKNQEYYLHKWQARQIARGFVDNTVNSLLETWCNSSVQSDEDDHYPNDGQVEQDAILMAIQSHGLQSSSLHLRPTTSSSNHERNLIDEFTNDNAENERNKEEEAEVYTAEGNSSSNASIPINEESLGMEETMDFLNAAVSVAIQKKGLSYGY
ncbi:uncharacterized protein LOC130895941 [Diorhabda carinulata]|uniref:uncharacterized protein LOC130895941 n=1 Tax=Diorhabda carinulata TaxID=1163345 RepID=UPI0025A0BE21|nr:uncharacterized protein LOC130895941 [Diorhabda carinulata]